MPKSQTLFIDIGKGLSLMIGLPTISRWETTKRPKKPKLGTFGFNTETNNLEYYDGKNWYSAKMDEA